MPNQAVLLLAHGTPETAEQIPEYLRNVVSGRPLPQTVIEEIQHRYALIGRSPLTEITLEQARLVESELAASGPPARVYVGMRNWRPYIADVVRKMRADEVEAMAVVCLAPQNSRTSVGLYRRAVAAEAAGMRIDFTESWADHPLLAEAFADRLRPVEARLRAETGEPTRTVQPPTEPEAGPRLWPGQGADPYDKDARMTADMVAARVSEIPRWWFAYQSQGASGGPWLGPTVEETLETIAGEGTRTLILQPIGFLCDHVEILYDVDRHFRDLARRRGVRLERPESLNASPILARAIAELARCGLARLSN
jgi:protoporphyrin/coproporphyrin ferrochelatase